MPWVRADKEGAQNMGSGSQGRHGTTLVSLAPIVNVKCDKQHLRETQRVGGVKVVQLSLNIYFMFCL